MTKNRTLAKELISDIQKKNGKANSKYGFSHCRVKNQSRRRIKCDISKPISRKIQDQWKKNWLNPTNLVREKSQKPSEVPSVVVSDGALEMVNCLIAAALLKHYFASLTKHV